MRLSRDRNDDKLANRMKFVTVSITASKPLPLSSATMTPQVTGGWRWKLKFIIQIQQNGHVPT